MDGQSWPTPVLRLRGLARTSSFPCAQVELFRDYEQVVVGRSYHSYSGGGMEDSKQKPRVGRASRERGALKRGERVRPAMPTKETEDVM